MCDCLCICKFVYNVFVCYLRLRLARGKATRKAGETVTVSGLFACTCEKTINNKDGWLSHPLTDFSLLHIHKAKLARQWSEKTSTLQALHVSAPHTHTNTERKQTRRQLAKNDRIISQIIFNIFFNPCLPQANTRDTARWDSAFIIYTICLLWFPPKKGRVGENVVLWPQKSVCVRKPHEVS